MGTSPDSIGESDERIPVTIVTGYLGSGKTTLLNWLVKDDAYVGSLIVVNEFGEVGIDHLLVSAPAADVVLLDNGCLCCSTQGDLVGTFQRIAKRHRDRGPLQFNQVILETSGLVDPVPLIQTLVTDEAISRYFCVDLVITLLDAIYANDHLKLNDESLKQLVVADVAIISKTDLVPASDLRDLKATVRLTNPGAAVISASHGMVDIRALIRCRRRRGTGDPESIGRWLGAQNRRDHDRYRHLHSSAEGHVVSYSMFYASPIARSGLVLWLNLLSQLYGHKLLRVKGLVNVNGAPVVIHVVQTVVHEPVALSKWPNHERRSRFVFIGYGLACAEIERTFAAFSFGSVRDVSSSFPDSRAYARFSEAARSFIR